MTISYGLKSEQIFDKFIGTIVETDKYICVRHPDNLNYFFGNYLLLKPGKYNKEQLEKDFSSLIGPPEMYSHKTFQWPKDTVDIDLNSFLSDDYKFMATKVLSTDKDKFVPTSKVSSNIEIITLDTDSDWQDWFNLELLQREDDQPLDQFEEYLNGKIRMYRSMIEADQGKWFGATIDKKLVGSVGFFHDEELGRFQSVLTHKSYRGQNICKTLVDYLSN